MSDDGMRPEGCRNPRICVPPQVFKCKWGCRPGSIRTCSCTMVQGTHTHFFLGPTDSSDSALCIESDEKEISGLFCHLDALARCTLGRGLHLALEPGPTLPYFSARRLPSAPFTGPLSLQASWVPASCHVDVCPFLPLIV
jgi:hypothetical protein